MKRTITLLGWIMIIVLSMTGCGNKEQQYVDEIIIMPETVSNIDEVPFVDAEGFTHAIKLDLPGEVKVFAFAEGENYEKVLDKFHEATKDTLQTTLTFHFADKISEEQYLQLASKADYDLIFDAFWLNSSKNLANGMYADLTAYFNNPNYPGIQAAFPEDVLDVIRYTDGKIYGIPYYTSFNSLNCIYYREDWRKELGLPEITDEDTLYQYLEGLKEHANELGIISPIGLGERGWFYFGCQSSWKLKDHIYEVDGTGARATQNMYVLLNEDNTKVLDATIVGDINHDFSLWPEGDSPLNKRILAIGNKWSEFVNVDAVDNEEVFSQFCQGLYGAVESSGAEIAWVEEPLKEAVPKAEVGCYLYDNNVRNMEKIPYEISFANNFMYVPYYCDDIDRTMAVVDWVFESRVNNELFSLGIEGEDWEAVGENQYRKIKENPYPYSFPEWLWSSNPSYKRMNADEPGKVIKYMEYAADTDNFIAHPFAGMSFNKSEVEVENAALIALQEEYYHYFMIGAYGESTKEKIEEFGEKAEEYIEVMRAEVIRQVQEYIDSH